MVEDWDRRQAKVVDSGEEKRTSWRLEKKSGEMCPIGLGPSPTLPHAERSSARPPGHLLLAILGAIYIVGVVLHGRGLKGASSTGPGKK